MGFAQDDNSGRAEDRQSAPHNEGFRMKKITKTVRSCISIAIVLGTVAATTAQERRITAREVVTEIQKQVGVQWQKDTVDTFKAGNPDTAVTGIAVTMMATMDVLQRASAKGLNFVITHEPTFYAHLDTPEGMPRERSGVGRETSVH